MISKKKKKKSVVKKKRRRQLKSPWMACGFDQSLGVVAGAAFAYDSTLDRTIGPVTISRRWAKDEDYFDRIHFLSKSHEMVQDLAAELAILIEPEDIFIAYEEPFPLGMVGRMESNSLKQQAQMSGAMVGGWLRWGYRNLYEITAHDWRSLVAAELGITTYHKKWNDPKLVAPKSFKFHCAPKDVGKFRAKQWVLDLHPEWGIPEWPDIIASSKHGLIPRPEDSKAQARQSDDRYEAAAMAEWMSRELLKGRDG